MLTIDVNTVEFDMFETIWEGIFNSPKVVVITLNFSVEVFIADGYIFVDTYRLIDPNDPVAKEALGYYVAGLNH